MKKLKNLWIRFWGTWYKIIKDDKTVAEILVYRHRVYIMEVKNESIN